MKKVKKMLAALLAAIMCLGVLSGCSGTEAGIYVDGEKQEINKLMTINGNDITVEEYRYYFLNNKKDMDEGNAEYWTEHPEKEQELKDKVLYYLKAHYAIKALADDNGVVLPEKQQEEVNAEIQEYIDQMGGEMNFAMAMSGIYTTPEYYREILLISRIQNAIILKLYGDQFLSDICRVKYIRMDLSDKEKAQRILDKVKAGEDFETLMKSYGNDDTMLTSDDGQYLKRSSTDQGYEDTAFSLEIGQTSGLVETVNGIFILKRYELDENYLISHLADFVKDRTDIIEDMSAKIEEKMDQLEVVYDPSYDMVSVTTVQ